MTGVLEEDSDSRSESGSDAGTSGSDDDGSSGSSDDDDDESEPMLKYQRLALVVVVRASGAPVVVAAGRAGVRAGLRPRIRVFLQDARHVRTLAGVIRIGWRRHATPQAAPHRGPRLQFCFTFLLGRDEDRGFSF